MAIKTPAELRDRIEAFTGRPPPGRIEVLEDTSEYMAIHRGMVLRLQGRDYYVTGDAREGRFGINEQPKFWVKYAVDLSTGLRKVIKLVFHEEFTSRLGPFLIRCSRSPIKESDILEIVRDHPHFMQGFTVRDARGNAIRILEIIQGETLLAHVVDIPQSHEEYFFQTFPKVLRSILPCVEGLAFLYERGRHHGDVRNDHILVEASTGRYRWIDFDYQVNYPDYDLWSVGNILIYAAGKGIHPIQTAYENPSRYPLMRERLTPEDAMLFYPYRVANLKKLFPYIPQRLNEVLVRFSVGARDFYTDFRSQVRDIGEVLSQLEKT